jgi:hypothetical protein
VNESQAAGAGVSSSTLMIVAFVLMFTGGRMVAVQLPSVLGVLPYLAIVLAIGFFTHDFGYLCRTFYRRAVKIATA